MCGYRWSVALESRRYVRRAVGNYCRSRRRLRRMRVWAPVVAVAVVLCGCVGGDLLSLESVTTHTTTTPAAPTSEPVTTTTGAPVTTTTSVPTQGPTATVSYATENPVIGPYVVEVPSPGDGFRIPDYQADPGRCFTPSKPAAAVGFDPGSGRRLWNLPVPFPSLKELVAVDDVVVLPVNVETEWGWQSLVAINSQGTPLWQAYMDIQIRGNPIPAGSQLIVTLFSDGPSAVASIDAHTGVPRWITPLEDPPIWRPPPPVSSDLGLVFVNSGADTIVALDLDSGEVAWTHRPGGRIDDSPVLGAGVLYLVAGDRSTLVALDPATGEALWTSEHPDETHQLGGVLAADDQVILVGGESERTIGDPAEEAWFTIGGFHPDDGSLLWEIEAAEWPVAGESILLIHPIVEDQSGWAIEAIDPLTGLSMWRRGPGGYGWLRSATIGPDLVVLPYLPGRDPPGFTVVNRLTGTTIFSVEAEGELVSPALIDADRVFAALRFVEGKARGRGAVHAVDLSDGSLLWTRRTNPNPRGTPLLIEDTLVVLVAEEPRFCA